MQSTPFAAAVGRATILQTIPPMSDSRFLLICLCAATIALSGCHRGKLSTSECSAMIKKQMQLLVPGSDVARETASTPEGDFAGKCDEFGKEGRIMYDCTMAANSNRQLQACMIEKETGVKLKP
jgi:hypothetical protein